ncbi:MAG: sugar transferase [bacterium]|nr:sugar transferase [bacterium]
MGSSEIFKKILLVAGDLVVFCLALLAAMAIRHQGRMGDPELYYIHFIPFGGLFFIWLIVFYIYSLYDLRYWDSSVSFLNLAAHAFTLNTLIAIAFFYFNPYVSIAPRTVLFVDIALSGLLFCAWRFLFNRALAKKLMQDIALAGASQAHIELAREFAKKPAWGYRVSCFVTDETYILPQDLAHIPVLSVQMFEKEMQHAERQPGGPPTEGGLRIARVIFSERPDRTTQHALSFFSLLSRHVTFQALPTFIERVFHKVPLSEVSESWFLENLSEGEKQFYEQLKRAFDIAGAIVLGVFTLPLMALVALGIKLEDGRRVLYTHTRLGRGGSMFRLLKFQSMIEHAEAGGPQWTRENDPRVTMFGSFLRSTRLDELPQLWNVLLGDLSFIGPRPERPEFVEKLEKDIPFYNLRHLVRPGLSGWAQINNPLQSVEESYEKLEYDLFYIKNRSFFLDVAIALKTLSIILRRKGR